MNSFYNRSELLKIGFKSVGENVLISRHASFYGAENMSIGSHVRIDDFCILSGKITLGSHIHISAYCALYGSLEIEMEDYTGLSPRCSIFSAMDDFSGDYLIGPMCNSDLTNVTGGKVYIRKYVQVGTGSIVFPNLIIEEGVAIGALSLINQSLTAWTIYAGIPARKVKERGRGLQKLI